MKVYAHFIEEGGVMYRWRTLLQFGNSWQVKGSVVMKNPGSAYPLCPGQPVSDMFVLSELQIIDGSAPWYEFKADITMSCIARLFGVDDGVIQIFNLFNIREADLSKALQLYEGLPMHKRTIISTTEQDISQLVAPVYLGWGPLGNDERFSEKARRIFDAVKDSATSLKTEFSDNPFFHPLYLMQYGAKKPEVIEQRKLFAQECMMIVKKE